MTFKSFKYKEIRITKAKDELLSLSLRTKRSTLSIDNLYN